MDAALLSCSDAYCLSVLNVANGIALCVFQCYEGNDKVTLSLVGDYLGG